MKERVMGKISEVSKLGKYILVYHMDLYTWREVQVFKTTESKWTIFIFTDYFIVTTLFRQGSRGYIDGTLILGN